MGKTLSNVDRRGVCHWLCQCRVLQHSDLLALAEPVAPRLLPLTEESNSAKARSAQVSRPRRGLRPKVSANNV